MRFEDWLPIYNDILSDFGYDRSQDEACARLLRMITLNSDLLTDEEIEGLFSETASVIGAAECMENDISNGLTGTVISAGSATKRVMDAGIVPDIVVTDLDGDIDSQLKASEMGAVTFIHAHGDNSDLVMGYAGRFKGKIVLTTQSRPEGLLHNYGGFTDGDRAYCIARHFGVRDIRLYGFDYDNPSSKTGSDPEIKRRKLSWAKRIISYDHDHYDQDQ